MDSEYCVPLPNSEEAITESTPSTSFEKRGRPCVSYGGSSESSKKRKNTMLVKEYGFKHIFNTYLQALRSIGEEAETKHEESLRIADKDKKNLISSFMQNASQKNMLTDEEALSVFIDLDLTKAHYFYMRKVKNERNCSIFPPYCKVQGIKQICYPPSSAIEITNTHAKILELQDLFDHTVARILTIDSVYCIEFKHLLLYSKWGCVGSSGQIQYKQKLPEESEIISDANLFTSSLVPIKLIDKVTSVVVRQNPAPSSVSFCRPICIEF